MIRYVAFALALLAAAPAHANWLDDAWTDDTVDRNGGPAITLNGEGVILVLPADTLVAAHAEGVGTKRAVTLFIERYGQHCSDIIDLDRKQKLHVQLFLSKPVDLNSASEETQQEVGDTLIKISGRHPKRPPDVQSLFVTEPEHRDFTIDYVPERKASCVELGDDNKTS
jgi:hypothetical protein